MWSLLCLPLTSVRAQSDTEVYLKVWKNKYLCRGRMLNGCPHLHGGNSPLVRQHQTHGPRSWGARVDDATEDSHIAPAAPSSGRATAPAAPVSLCCQNPLELCHHLLQWQEHMLNSAVPLGTWKKLFPHTAHNLGLPRCPEWKNTLPETPHSSNLCRTHKAQSGYSRAGRPGPRGTVGAVPLLLLQCLVTSFVNWNICI